MRWVIDDVANSGDAATSRCELMTWRAQWLVVGGCMVAVEVAVGVCCSKVVVGGGGSENETS